MRGSSKGLAEVFFFLVLGVRRVLFCFSLFWVIFFLKKRLYMIHNNPPSAPVFVMTEPNRF